MFRETDERVLRTHMDLIHAGTLLPASRERPEAERWVACEIACMVEGCFGRHIDPFDMPRTERERWLGRLGDTYHYPRPDEPEHFAYRYWMLDGDHIAGTVMLGLHAVEERAVPIQSLFTLPRFRGRGVATRTLQAVFDALRRRGLGGVRLDTYWTWQRSLRFYLDRQMWVTRWKRDLGLVWMVDLPRYQMEIAQDRARFRAESQRGHSVVLEAERRGERLVLRREPAHHQIQDDAELWRLRFYAVSTFAVALALQSWPLIRSEAHWLRAEESRDIGEPEGLAWRIERFEAEARRRGWIIETPRIPGLRYRSHDELEPTDSPHPR